MPTTLYVEPAPISKKSITVVSWPYHANWNLLNSLNNGCYLGGHQHTNLGEASNTILLYAVFKALDYKLNGTALDASRGKFTHILIDTQLKDSMLTFVTEPTFSAVRKILTIASKNFNPARVAPLYKKYSQLLDIKVDSSHFAHSCNEFAKGAKSLAVFITGTIKIPDGKTADLKATADAMSAAPETVTGEKAPSKGTDVEGLKVFDEIVCKDRLETFIVQQLLQTMQIESHVRNGNLIPITGSSKWDTVKNKFDADRIKRFVELKLVKLGDKLPAVLRFMCSRSGYFTAAELHALPKTYTAASLTALIKKHF
jgi:hypothetical protein